MLRARPKSQQRTSNCGNEEMLTVAERSREIYFRSRWHRIPDSCVASRRASRGRREGEEGWAEGAGSWTRGVSCRGKCVACTGAAPRRTTKIADLSLTPWRSSGKVRAVPGGSKIHGASRREGPTVAGTHRRDCGLQSTAGGGSWPDKQVWPQQNSALLEQTAAAVAISHQAG